MMPNENVGPGFQGSQQTTPFLEDCERQDVTQGLGTHNRESVMMHDGVLQLQTVGNGCVTSFCFSVGLGLVGSLGCFASLAIGWNDIKEQIQEKAWERGEDIDITGALVFVVLFYYFTLVLILTLVVFIPQYCAAPISLEISTHCTDSAVPYCQVQRKCCKPQVVQPFAQSSCEVELIQLSTGQFAVLIDEKQAKFNWNKAVNKGISVTVGGILGMYCGLVGLLASALPTVVYCYIFRSQFHSVFSGLPTICQSDYPTLVDLCSQLEIKCKVPGNAGNEIEM